MQNSNKALTIFFSTSKVHPKSSGSLLTLISTTLGNYMKSNTTGILISRPHGGYRLAKQTEWGEEYVAFAYTSTEAWKRLARVTGRSVQELKTMPITKVQ